MNLIKRNPSLGEVTQVIVRVFAANSTTENVSAQTTIEALKIDRALALHALFEAEKQVGINGNAVERGVILDTSTTIAKVAAKLHELRTSA